MSEFRSFPVASLKFLQQIRRHNNREWFEKNRTLYEENLKRPLQGLIDAVGKELRKDAREIVADPAKSAYRIYRDVRFSADKSPYKTQVAAIFPMRGMAKNSGPGLYFHYSADEVLIAGGVYVPGADYLRAIREHIARHYRKLRKILDARRYRELFGELEGEQLKKTPKGFSPDHPAEHYFRFKQFLFGRQYPPELALSGKLVPEMLHCFRAGMPLIRFLAEPLNDSRSRDFASDKLFHLASRKT